MFQRYRNSNPNRILYSSSRCNVGYEIVTTGRSFSYYRRPVNLIVLFPFSFSLSFWARARERRTGKRRKGNNPHQPTVGKEGDRLVVVSLMKSSRQPERHVPREALHGDSYGRTPDKFPLILRIVSGTCQRARLKKRKNRSEGH